MVRACTRVKAAGILGAAILACACGASGGGQATPQPRGPSPSPPPTPSPFSVLPMASPHPESPSDAARQAAVEAARSDAAVRLGTTSGAADVQVERVEAREWPDASLGCPSQDAMYSQVVTPGYLVVVSARGKQLEYHADARGTIAFCKET